MPGWAGCPWCWTSHGCDLDDGHDGDHECRAGHVDLGDPPDVMPRGAPDVFHYRTFEPEPIRSPS